MVDGLASFASWLTALPTLCKSPKEGSILAEHFQMKARQRHLTPGNHSLQQQQMVFPAVSLEFHDSVLAWTTLSGASWGNKDKLQGVRQT